MTTFSLKLIISHISPRQLFDEDFLSDVFDCNFLSLSLHHLTDEDFLSDFLDFDSLLYLLSSGFFPPRLFDDEFYSDFVFKLFPDNNFNSDYIDSDILSCLHLVLNEDFLSDLIDGNILSDFLFFLYTDFTVEFSNFSDCNLIF